jgi:hypothetical protein
VKSVFFTDRDLGKQFPEILRSAGLTVERHADHFKHECPDEVWLEAIGRRKWIAVTHDRRIRYKPNELSAVVRHDVQLLVVVGRAPFAELAQGFIATHARIEKFIAVHDAPWIAKVYRPSVGDLAKSPTASGHVELWYPPS